MPRILITGVMVVWATAHAAAHDIPSTEQVIVGYCKDAVAQTTDMDPDYLYRVCVEGAHAMLKEDPKALDDGKPTKRLDGMMEDQIESVQWCADYQGHWNPELQVCADAK